MWLAKPFKHRKIKNNVPYPEIQFWEALPAQKVVVVKRKRHRVRCSVDFGADTNISTSCIYLEVFIAASHQSWCVYRLVTDRQLRHQLCDPQKNNIRSNRKRRKETLASRRRHAKTEKNRQKHKATSLTAIFNGPHFWSKQHWTETQNEKKNKSERHKWITKKQKIIKKQWVILQHKNTLHLMRLTQQMGVSAVTRLTNGSCVVLYRLRQNRYRCLQLL